MGMRFKTVLNKQFEQGWNILPQIFEDEGLVGVVRDLVSSDRVVETRERMTRNGMQAIFGWARMVAEKKGEGDELDGLEVEVGRDIESGCYVRFDIHVAVGFKRGS